MFYPLTPLLEIYTREILREPYKGLHMKTFIAVLFITVKNGNGWNK